MNLNSQNNEEWSEELEEEPVKQTNVAKEVRNTLITIIKFDLLKF